MAYAYIKDNKLVGSGICSVTGGGLTCIEITDEVFNNIEQYMYVNGEIVINPNYEEEKAKAERIEEILAELQTIDNKSIRAIRANDTEYIQMYEEQAESLREELRGLNDNI